MRRCHPMVRRLLGGVFFEGRCSGEHLEGLRERVKKISLNSRKNIYFIANVIKIDAGNLSLIIRHHSKCQL